MYDIKTLVHTFVIITGTDIHDTKFMERIPYEEKSFYTFERAYMAKNRDLWFPLPKCSLL